MKFKGTPGQAVTITNPRMGEVKHFVFDENGIYETHHPFTVLRMKNKFEVAEEAQPKRKCKKCDAEFDNQGDLLAHYRQEHPKK